MHPTSQKEEFSRAYVKAIAAQAGWNPYTYDVDDDSIDIGLGVSENSRARLEIQLKCTSSAIDDSKSDFPFDLPLKNYNDLRAEAIVPRLLVVVCVPKDVGEWTQQTEQELCLRHCGYWHSLAGEPASKNTETVRVHISRENIFSVDFLKNAMQRIAAGEQL